MQTLSIEIKRLLTLFVTSLIAVCWFYWATRRSTDVTSAPLAINRLTQVAEHRTPPCGFQTFRDVARQRTDGYIPGSGTWTRNGTHRMERFQPSVCRLTHGKWIPEHELVTCLRRDRVRYIAIVADSNGRGYLFSLRRLLSEAPVETPHRRVSCGPIFRHVELKYKSYRLPQVLVKHRCPCGGYCTLEFSDSMRSVHCDVQQVRCTVDNDTNVILEYITSWFTIDPKLQVCCL